MLNWGTYHSYLNFRVLDTAVKALEMVILEVANGSHLCVHCRLTQGAVCIDWFLILGHVSEFFSVVFRWSLPVSESKGELGERPLYYLLT